MMRYNKKGLFGYREKRSSQLNPEINVHDKNDGLRLIYRYREENIAIANMIKDIQAFVDAFSSSENYSKNELFSMASSIANVLDTRGINVSESSVSKEKLEQIFTTLTYNVNRVNEIFDKLLSILNEENQELTQFIKAKKSYAEIYVQIERLISSSLEKQDALRQELSGLMPNIDKLVEESELLETQEVETLATNYVSYYYELEKLVKDSNSTNDELFSALERICLFMRKIIGNLEYLNQVNENEFLFELGLQEDNNHEHLKQELDGKGITQAAKTHPKKFAQNFFRANRGQHITQEIENSKQKEQGDKIATLQSVLKRLTTGIKSLNDSLNERFKEGVDTSKIEEEYWNTIGVKISNQIVTLNNHIRNDLLTQLTTISNQIDKSKISYLDVVFSIPTSQFDKDLSNWENKLLQSLPKPTSDINKFSIDESKALLLQNQPSTFSLGGSHKHIDPQNIQEQYAHLSKEEQELYNELEGLSSQLQGGTQQIQDLIRIIDEMSQRAKTTQTDKKGNSFTQEYPNMHEAMGTVYWRIKSLEQVLEKLREEKDEKNKKLKEITKKLQSVQLELEKVLTRAVAVQIIYEVEQMLRNYKTYYDEVIGPQYVGKIISQKDKKDDDKTKKELWSSLNKQFSESFDSFSF